MALVRDPYLFQPIRWDSAKMMFFSEHLLNVDLLKDGYVFVDVGASMGQNMRFLLNNVKAKPKKFYAFEPNRKAFEYLKYWKSKYPDIVEIHNMAVSGAKSTGKAVFLDYTDPENHKHIGWGHLLGFNSREDMMKAQGTFDKAEKYEVDVLKFNDLWSIVKEPKIDFMTIDTEGHEREILADCEKHVFDNVQQVCLEIHRSDMVDYYREVLGRNGFAFVMTAYKMTVYAARERLNTHVEGDASA